MGFDPNGCPVSVKPALAGTPEERAILSLSGHCRYRPSSDSFGFNSNLWARVLLVSTVSKTPTADPCTGDCARWRRYGCRGSPSIACPARSFRDTAERHRDIARLYSNRIVDNGRPYRREWYKPGAREWRF